MPLAAGDKLGPYEILGAIGVGAMGEVYRARGTRLHINVALKVSAARFPERFEREVRAITSLNHPNICTLYDFGPNYLAVELVEGPTLAERLTHGAIPLEESLRIARLIAAALEAAHEKGIIHGDLKPANIKIKPDGAVKVLDFGLARQGSLSASGVSAGDAGENSPAISTGTQTEAILGTAAYVAPEQARGKAVDKRADIWAFGVVLYEMVTGKRLFQGEDLAEALASVIKDQPDFTPIPAEVRPLLERCLAKDRKNRLRDIGDMELLLAEHGTVPGTVPPSPVPGRRFGWLAWIAAWSFAGVCLLAAAGLGWLYLRKPVAPPVTEALRVIRFFVPSPEKSAADSQAFPVLSPDGRRMAFTASTGGQKQLWIRELDSFAAHPLPGTENPMGYFWSPDSRFLAFGSGGKLNKIEVSGGPVVALCDSENPPYGGAWSNSGVILFTPVPGPVFRVSATGGTPTAVTTLEAGKEIVHIPLAFLPDGHHFLYVAASTDIENSPVYVGELDSKARHQVLAGPLNVLYSPPGYLVFGRDRTVMAQAFDISKLQTTGDQFPIAENVARLGTGPQIFSISQTGTLAYSASNLPASVQLAWFDRYGKPGGTVGSRSRIQWGAISPDGNTLAYDRNDSQSTQADVWLHDLKHGSDSRFTFGPQFNIYPVWSPDGSNIAFYSGQEGGFNLYQRGVAGTAPPEQLTKDTRIRRLYDWSHDGRYIIAENFLDPKTKADIWVVPLAKDKPGDGKPYPYLNGASNETNAKLSPNGHWLAYVSDESKRKEVYVVTFPNLGGKWPISFKGGDFPVWSRDGKELYFIAPDKKMMAVEIKDGANFSGGSPKPLFDTHLGSSATWFDVSKDGRFLIPTAAEEPGSAPAPFNVVVNWPAALKK